MDLRLTSVETTVSGEAATIGAIGIRSKSIFVSPPLTQYKFDSCCDEDPRVISNLCTSDIDCLALSHDERSLAYSASTAIKLVDLQTGRELRTLVGHNGRLNVITQSNRSIYIWASAASDGSVTLWDTRQHPASVFIRRFDRSLNSARFSPNDALIALGSDHLHMLDLRIRQVRSLSMHSQVLHVCFHPSEYLLATASEDRLVRFWDIDTEECVSQSDPLDSVIRKICFHEDGSSLLTLTDCKCSAVSWEPYEMLGQCILPQSDYSLDMAANDSDVLVVGRSVSLSSVILLNAPYAKLLTQELLELDKVDEDHRDLISETGTGTESSETDLFEKALTLTDDQQAFVPTRTLPRTPPPEPRKLPQPRDSNFSVSMIPARPKSLKSTQRNHRVPKSVNNVKKSSLTTIPRPSRSSLSTKHSSDSQLKVTSSAPDVRCTAAKKTAGKKTRVTCGLRTDEQKGLEVASEPCTVENIVGMLDEMELFLSQRRSMLDKVLQCWRSKGSDAAFGEATRSNDPSIIAELIDAFNHSPNSWTLTLCTLVLPQVELLMTMHKQEDFIEVALCALRMIITNFGEVIRTGAKQRSQLGVDVQADERHAKCTKCVRLLTNMRVKASLIADQMNRVQAREFNALMQIFDDTLSPV